MKINTLRKKVSKIVDDLYAQIEKLSDLAGEFDDSEYSDLTDSVVDSLEEVLNEDYGPVAELLNWLENYEEYKEEDTDE
ncbi:MAG: hypothetical protein IKU15_01065 [Clostridia bacterium]|jgi:hypothetical protein|nr:hypothetical protein [Clostridia bacterium]